MSVMFYNSVFIAYMYDDTLLVEAKWVILPRSSDKITRTLKALKIHSVIYWWIYVYTNRHCVFHRNMSQMNKIALFSSLRDQIWPYRLFSKYSYTTSGLGGHIGLLRKIVILWIFWHQPFMVSFIEIGSVVSAF